jgi:hypothetical protein
MFQINVLEKIKTHVLYWVTFFSSRKSRRLWDNVEKYCRAGDVTDDGMVHAHYVMDTKGYKYTLGLCNNYVFSTAIVVLHECSSMLLFRILPCLYPCTISLVKDFFLICFYWFQPVLYRLGIPQGIYRDIYSELFTEMFTVYPILPLIHWVQVSVWKVRRSVNEFDFLGHLLEVSGRYVWGIYKLLNQLFALVSSCSKNLLHFWNFFTLIKILKLQHVSVPMDHPQGVCQAQQHRIRINRKIQT